jgi:hypothetical protein
MRRPHVRLSRQGSGTQAAVALLAYGAISLIYFGLPVLGDPAHTTIGVGNSDAATFMWSLAWWPHAVLHGLNPFVTHVAWAPAGFNLTWATAIPSLALVAAPITLAFGPIVAFNVVTLLAPATAAWAAFLLCRRLTGTLWPSFLGGYVFGFSSYEIGQMLGHLHLSFTAAIPLSLYLVVRYLQGALRPWPFVVLLGLCFAFQVGTSTEVFFTMVVIGGIVYAVAVSVAPASRRAELVALLRPLAGAGLVAAAVLAPFLWYAFAYGVPATPLQPPEVYSMDLLNPAIPTAITRVGRTSFAGVAALFSGNLAEDGAYIGIVLLLMAIVYLGRRARTFSARVVGAAFFVPLVLALGPHLHIAGVATILLPWRAVSHLPIFEHVLPVRLVMYSFLALAVMLSMCLSERRDWRRWAVAVCGVALLAPNTALPAWKSVQRTPALFIDGGYRQFIGNGGTALVIPYGVNGSSMLWQAQAGFGFRMAGGYFSYTPASFETDPTVRALLAGQVPTSARQLRAFVRDHRVRAVMVDPQYPGAWEALFSMLGVTPVASGGMMVARLP